ncbi:MAG: exodeoxyribonuclease V subunit gamma, partial [Pseudomonadota bacterium]
FSESQIRNIAWRLSEDIQFDTRNIAWRLYKLLPGLIQDESFTELSRYLETTGDEHLRRWHLATKLADVYDQYLIYRPDWIIAWENGELPTNRSLQWQAQLWRALMDDADHIDSIDHRARLHNALMAQLSSGNVDVSPLPTTLRIFGIASLPPIHLETFLALSHVMDVEVFFQNPCAEYWGDIVSTRDQARQSVRALVNKDTDQPLIEDDYLSVGNPLLASMGHLGREFLEQLLTIDSLHVIDDFARRGEVSQEPASHTLLSTIQDDILDMTFAGTFDNMPAEPLATPLDDSVQIHACHSRMREVEVLFDALHTLLDDNNPRNIAAQDIIVMMPDVSAYAPYIEAVFEERIAHTIVDRSWREESPTTVAFLKLLQLPLSRLSAVEMMDLIEVPGIARRFQLNEADLQLITRWITETGIRWEFDGDAKSRWQVPPEPKNTWQWGRARLLTGLAMEQASGPVEGVLPLDVDVDDAETLGSFLHLIHEVGRYRSLLARAYNTPHWRRLLLGMIDDFFDAEGDEGIALTMIRDAIFELDDQATGAGVDSPVSHQLIHASLTSSLSEPRQHRGFMRTGVTFATLVPMRSIPFKVVCLLGMNDADFPRRDRPVSFDGISKAPRRGDRSRRSDDRYLFLEALTAATDVFYISYLGRGIRDNQEKPPSVLVTEFMDYLQRGFERELVTVHPLQPFSTDYYSAVNPSLRSWDPLWYEALQQTAPPKPFVSGALPPSDTEDINEMDVSDLTRFFRHPVRFWLNVRLGVNLQIGEDALADTETFQLSPLARYQIADAALATLARGDDVEAFREAMVTSGLVLPGPMGNRQLDQQIDKAVAVAAALAQFDEAPTAINHVIGLPNNLTLTGHIDNIRDNILLDIRTGQLRKRQLIDLWIRHLFACTTGSVARSIAISVDKEAPVLHALRAVSPDQAISLLSQLTVHFKDGLQAPLMFIPETSYAWASSLAAGDSEHQATRKAQRTWSQTAYSEAFDREYQRVFNFDDLYQPAFESIAVDIWQPVLEHLDSVS